MASNSIFAPLTKEEPGFQAVVNVKEKVEQVEDNFSKSKERGKRKVERNRRVEKLYPYFFYKTT